MTRSAKRLAAFAALLSLPLLALPLSAQRITGQIQGTVSDPDQGVLPGVTVSLTGDTIVGTQTAQTGETGFYRFIALPPGVYELAFSLDNFAPVTRNGVRVAVGSTTVEDVTLALGAIEEAINVTVEAPVVDTTSNEVGINFGRAFVENIPVQRQSFNDLVAAAPGSLRAGDQSARTMVYGSSYDENSFQLDGADVNDNFFNEQLAQPNVDAIEEVEVLSLGAPAEYGNLTGAVYNIVTRQGGNAFHGDLNAYYQGDSLTEENTSDEEDGGFPYHRDRYRDYTAQLGGPIARDRVWFFASYQIQEDSFANAGVDPEIGTAVNEYDRLFAKLNWQINSSHRLVGTFNQDEAKEAIALTPDVSPTTAVTRNIKTPTPGLGYTGVLSADTLLEVRYSGFYGSVDMSPTDPSLPRDQARVIDLDTGFISGGHYYWYELEPTRTTVNAKVSHLADEFLGGSHDFRFGVQYNEAEAGGIYGYNDLILTYGNGQYGYGYSRVPFSYSGNTEGLGGFADDTWKLNERLTLNLGVRYDRNKAFSKAQDELDEDGRPTGRTFPRADHYTWDYVSPRLGFNYLLTGDGKTVLKGHVGRYHRAIATGEFANVIGPSIKPIFLGTLNPATGGLEDLVQITDNSNLLIDPDYKSPHTDQFILSLERRLRRNMGLTLNLVYKSGRDFAAWQDVGGIYEEVVFIDNRGVDTTGNPITVFRLVNDISDLSYVITNRDEMDNDIYAASLGFVKPMANNWSLSASLAYLKSEGRTPDSGGGTSLEQRGGLQFRVYGRNPNDFVNTGGRLRGDSPWQFKSQLIYLLPKDFSVSANLAYRTGANRARQVRINDVTGLPTAILAQERGTYGRLPSATFLDLRLQKDFVLPNDFRLGLTADVFNVLNDDANEAVQSSLGTSSSFNVPDAFVTPRRLMVGAKLRF